MNVVVATRKSRLALAQARAWMTELRATGVGVQELLVVTTGDREQRTPLSEIGGKGLFIKEIEEALLDGRAHAAVHSMKDVPGALAPGCRIACVPRRADPRDALVTRDGCRFEDLPAGARVGTSSLRRALQLRRWRGDVDIVPLRGNVDTRLGKCEAGEVDAVVLALAGLERLGLADRATEILDPSRSLPAIGQGALAIETRSDDAAVIGAVAALGDPETLICVSAERGVMLAAEGSCQIPIAGYAVREGDALYLRAMLAEPDGTRARWREARVPWPGEPHEAERIGFDVGLALKAAG
jgi:hydroxymethylbilane synthase